jgi:translation initiation factor 2D
MGRVSEVPYTGLSSQLSKFLQHMQQEQIVQVKELSKGVESIVAVDWRHPR